jgi:hypothetical protein
MINCANQYGYGRNYRLPQLPKSSIIKLSKRAFQSFLQHYELIPDKEISDCEQFFSYYSNQLIYLINSLIKTLAAIKVQFCIQVTFSRELVDLKTYQISYFCTKNIIISKEFNFKNLYKITYSLENKIQDFQERGSNWRVEKIDKLDIKVEEYNSLYGGCHRILPQKLFLKQAILNIKSFDQKCFLYCILAHLFPTKESYQRSRLQYYLKHISKLNTTNLKYPVSLKMISKFENNNKKYDLRINVYEWSNLIDKTGHVLPLQISKSKGKNVVNLLLLDKHYYYI